jgi:hypothetical protein
MWSSLSDEGTGLSFTIAAGPRQGSHSRDGVPWDLRPYFTVPDPGLPFSSPPTTHRATVEVLSVSFYNSWAQTHGKHRQSVVKNVCLLACYQAMEILGLHKNTSCDLVLLLHARISGVA